MAGKLTARKTVVTDKLDPLAGRRNANASPASSAKPTFGVMADEFVATHEGGWRNPKHRWQWTLGGEPRQAQGAVPI
jgi:hypothetical protein